MKLRIIKVGRAAYPEIRSMVGAYAARLPAFAAGEEFKDLNSINRLLPKGGKGTLLVALDERGTELTSENFAAHVRKWRDNPAVKEVLFVIGGPHGLPDEVKRRADMLWSLSRATLTSDIAWLVVWEQTYRAFNILAGTSYHHV